MMIKIKQLERTLKDDIVLKVHCRFRMSSENNMVDEQKCVILNEPEDDFIPFDELTQEDVIGWLDIHLDLEEIEANLNARLHELDNPTTTVGLPWGQDELPS